MKESKDEAILPCYRDGYGVWHHSDKNHDKVYGVNKQMCDIDKLLSEAGYFRMICDGQIETRKKLIDMEEKKTKKMTKAEAFEWLKNKKVYVDSNSAAIQEKLFEAGFEWPENKRHISHLERPFLVLSEGGGIFYSNNMCHYLERSNEEIKAEDILSLEIIEEKYELEFNYDKVVELAKPLMHYLNEVGCQDSIRVSQLGIVHEPMSTLIFDNGIGE